MAQFPKDLAARGQFSYLQKSRPPRTSYPRVATVATPHVQGTRRTQILGRANQQASGPVAAISDAKTTEQEQETGRLPVVFPCDRRVGTT